MHFHVGICRGLTVGTVTPWSCSIHWWIQFYLLKESNIYGYDYQIMVGISIFQDMGHFWVRLNFLWYFLLNTSMFWKVKRFLHVGFDYIRVHNLFFFWHQGQYSWKVIDWYLSIQRKVGLQICLWFLSKMSVTVDFCLWLGWSLRYFWILHKLKITRQQ